LTILGLTAGLFLGSLGAVNAQKSKVRYAGDQMELMNYQHALELYKEAYAKKPTYSTAKKVAMAQDKTRDYALTFDWWKTTVGYEEAKEEDYIQLLRTGILTDSFKEANSIVESKGLSADSLGITASSIPSECLKAEACGRSE
jgi:hypothetical protein